VQFLHEKFAVSLDETTLSRELRELGYVKLTAHRLVANVDPALE
jgi:arginine repressor